MIRTWRNDKGITEVFRTPREIKSLVLCDNNFPSCEYISILSDNVHKGRIVFELLDEKFDTTG